MKKKTVYTEGPIGKLEIIPDFLPLPEQLVGKDDPVKITIAFNRKSIAFFKAEAARYGVPYQRMIRRVVDAYAERYLVDRPRQRSQGRKTG